MTSYRGEHTSYKGGRPVTGWMGQLQVGQVSYRGNRAVVGGRASCKWDWPVTKGHVKCKRDRPVIGRTGKLQGVQTIYRGGQSSYNSNVSNCQ